MGKNLQSGSLINLSRLMHKPAQYPDCKCYQT